MSDRGVVFDLGYVLGLGFGIDSRPVELAFDFVSQVHPAGLDRCATGRHLVDDRQIEIRVG